MIVKKHRRLVVRMGQYESHEIIAEVMVDTDNKYDRALINGIREGELLDDSLPDSLAVANFLDDTLQEIVSSDVAEAAFNTSDPDSFIHEYHKNNNPK